MAIWHRTALGLALICASVLCIGYLTAWLSLAPCADETFRDIQSKGIRGTDMLGNKITLAREGVTANIAGPFLVETRYMVPYDLHGSLHFSRYFTFPWGRYERSSRVIDLVMGSAADSQLSANNSFKPNTLRGGNVQRCVSFLLPPQSVSA